ncbi:MAG TPA: hypothetical protein PK910_04820 [Bacteroidales bacterium]|nr:hypothetical protein [Bacteroidales bacterium]HRC89325.1 hypothetical protein [Bacteroidales bacterium]
MKQLSEMKPDRTNYEIWLTNYLDGRLDDNRLNLLMDFLDKNPDIRKEFENILFFRIKSEDNPFPGKERLKKNLSDIDEDQFILLCIGSLEKDLIPEQENELYQIIVNDEEKKKNFEIFQKTKLHPPKSEFRYKHRLKKLSTTAKIARLSTAALCAVASIALFFILVFSPQNKQTVLPAGNIAESKQNQTIKNDPLEFTADKIKHEATPASTETNIIETKLALQPVKEIDYIAPETLEQGTAKPEKILINKLAFKEDIILDSYMPTQLYIANESISHTLIDSEEDSELTKSLIVFFRKKILKNPIVRDDELKPYEIAEAGITGLNKLLGWQMVLNQRTDEAGEIISLNFNSKLLKLNLPVKKSE